jgi:alkylation response protein AidB-like acyl-CoA dehydrogenase
VVETWDTMGCAHRQPDLTLTDVAVPEASLVFSRPPGNPTRRRPGFAWFGLSIASVYTGIAIAARDFAVESRSQPPAVRAAAPIAHLPGVQFLVADMDIKLAAARALTLQTADGWMAAGSPAQSISPPWSCPHFATNAAIEVANHAMQLVGGVGMFRRHPLERLYRDVRAGPFHPFGNDIAREIIGKAGLGVPLDDEPRWG